MSKTGQVLQSTFFSRAEEFLHACYTGYFCSYVAPYGVATPWCCWVTFSLWSAVTFGGIPESFTYPLCFFVVDWSYVTVDFCHCTYRLVFYLFKTISPLYLDVFEFWSHPCLVLTDFSSFALPANFTNTPSIPLAKSLIRILNYMLFYEMPLGKTL